MTIRDRMTDPMPVARDHVARKTGVVIQPEQWRDVERVKRRQPRFSPDGAGLRSQSVRSRATGPYRAPSEAVYPQDFGGRGDGVADDLAAINLATAAANAAGGGTVYFPVGTYIVGLGSEASGLRIKAYSDVSFRGDGVASRIKVKDNAGNYPCIIGAHTSLYTVVNNVTIEGLYFDSNAAGNTTSSINSPPGLDTCLVSVYLVGSDIQIRHNRFDAVGVNTVSVNGANLENIVVESNVFTFALGASPTTTYDNTAVYVHAKRQRIVDNLFHTDSVANLAGNAIEVHGNGVATVSGNISWNYRGLCGPVNESDIAETEIEHTSITVSDNIGYNVALGVFVLAYIPSKSMSQVRVADNLFYVGQIQHDMAHSGGVSVICTGDADGIVIDGNRVVFEPGDTRVTGGDDAAHYVQTAGIRVYNTTGSTNGGLRSVSLRKNVIQNAPFAAILVDATFRIDNLTIVDNELIDFGHNKVSAVGEAYNAGVMVVGSVERGVIADNVAFDNGSTLIGKYIVRSDFATALTDVVVKRNLGFSQSATKLVNLHHASAITGYATQFTDWPSIAAGGEVTMTVPVAGAKFGEDTVHVGWAGPLPDGISLKQAWVSVDGTVSIRLRNDTAGAINPAGIGVYVRVEPTA